MAAPVRLISSLSRLCRVTPLNNVGLCNYHSISTQSGSLRQLSSKLKCENVCHHILYNGQALPYKHATPSSLRCMRTFVSRSSQNTSHIHVRHRGLGLPAKQLLQINTHRCQPPKRTFQKVGKNRETRGGLGQQKTGPKGGGTGEAGITLMKSLAFAVGVSICSFTGCMIWYYEDTRSQTQRFERHLRASATQKVGFRQDMEHIWNQIPPGPKVVAGIIAANFAVYLLWRVPVFASTLQRYFLLSADNPRLSMLCSSFSHVNFVHIFMNMYVFWSFKDIASKLGREQFMAVYLSAAVVSSLMSQVNMITRAFPAGSLGASGALMAVLGMYWHFLPEGRLSVPFVYIFWPHSFSLDTGVKFLLAMDTLGLILGWQRLDHAAHLGGLLFGYWYAKYGRELIWSQRYKVIRQWRKFRE
ncbi:presenilin-associated rhomboid-like protein, mitochondrial [Ylistrum balloti]|uniref:presenilin-associated rhomboid-like protein, mitochondrial n=1 Tax=Ylistrum balloti TaxID=509963 RepID=UPI002905D0A4|nr:presenilin-associated rhomboid-like protein, mitochondrial [Ylistrum balloti]